MDYAQFLPYISGILGGMFGNQNQLPPEVQRAVDMAMANAKELKQYAHSPVFGGAYGAQERAGLATDRGLAGQGMQQNQERMLGAMSMNNQGNVGDFLTNLNNEQQGRLQNINSQHIIAALNNRQGALDRSTNAALGAGGLAAGSPRGGGMDITSALGGLASTMAYNAARKPAAAPGPDSAAQIHAIYGVGNAGQQNLENAPYRQDPQSTIDFIKQVGGMF